MNMTPEQWQQLKELYCAADQTDGENDGKLAIADSELASLYRRLRAAGSSEGFLDRPIAILDHDVTETIEAISAIRTRAPGDRLCDRFDVVRFVARGEMGEVYQAYDSELREPVALKPSGPPPPIV